MVQGKEEVRTFVPRYDPFLTGQPKPPSLGPCGNRRILARAGRKGARKSILAGERRRSASHAHELKAALGWLVLIYPRASVFPVLLFRRQGFRSVPGAARLYRARSSPPSMPSSYGPARNNPARTRPNKCAVFSIPYSQSSRRTSRRAGH